MYLSSVETLREMRVECLKILIELNIIEGIFNQEIIINRIESFLEF